VKKETKIALAVGGATVAGVALYFIFRPPPSAVAASAPTPPPPSNAPVFAPPTAPRATYLLQPTGPVEAGMHVGETIQITPVVSDPTLVWAVSLKPTSSGGPLTINPSLAEVNPTPTGMHLTSGTYKAIATGTAVIHLTPGVMEDHGTGPDFTMSGAPGFDVTIVVS
jgi:hypothetical protein